MHGETFCEERGRSNAKGKTFSFYPLNHGTLFLSTFSPFLELPKKLEERSSHTFSSLPPFLLRTYSMRAAQSLAVLVP